MKNKPLPRQTRGRKLPQKVGGGSLQITVVSHDLDEINTLIQSRLRNITAKAKGTSLFLAREYLRRLKERVLEGDPRWVPLKPSYVRYKQKHGLWEGPWMATTELLSKLAIYELDNGKGYFIGWPADEIHTGSGLTCRHLADILENGRAEVGIPARPLFRKVRREMKMWWRSWKKENG